MIVLVLNCGSSSIKYQLFEMAETTQMLAKGLIERIGLNDSILTHKPTGKEPYKVISDIPDHTLGINMVMSALTQILRETEWSEADVMVIDMPPGTGDVQLTMLQPTTIDMTDELLTREDTPEISHSCRNNMA